MSIIRMLARTSAVAALRGRTWADDRVYDSDNTPLAQALALTDKAKPYIVVYTDTDNRLEVTSTDVYGSRRELQLVLEIGVASKIAGKTGETELSTPLTDEGMEIALDMVEDQAMAALFGSVDNDWVELLKKLILNITAINGQRGAQAERDRRWAARSISFMCDVVSDLPPGVEIPPEHPIRMFVKASEQNPGSEMDHVAEICDALIDRSELPKWEQIQATLGLRREDLQAIGLAPLPDAIPAMVDEYGDSLTDKDGEAPLLRKITLDDMQMDGDEKVGKIDPISIETDVGVVKPKPTQDVFKADGEGP